jgi:hypothetical protein
MINVTAYYTPLTLIILHVAYFYFNLFSIIVLSLLTSQGEYFVAAVFLFVRKLPVTILHILIYLFILVSYQCLNHGLVHWEYASPNNDGFISNLITDNFNLMLKLNTSYVECSFFTLIVNQITDTGWSFFHKTTNLQNHPFQHNLNSSNTFQGLLVSMLEYVHNIIVSDGSSHVLSTLTTLLLVWGISLIKKHVLIIF